VRTKAATADRTIVERRRRTSRSSREEDDCRTGTGAQRIPNDI
jgi:hypothetical protein